MNNRDVKKKPLHSLVMSRSAAFLTSCLLMLALMLSLTDCKKNTKEAGEDETIPPLGQCQAVAITGRLSYNSSTGIYTYRTSGGGTITINPASMAPAVTFLYDGFPSFRLELWGYLEANGQPKLAGSHESLIGKHIKDRFGARRTIILPDGAKATLVSPGAYGIVSSISIYDTDQSHHINLSCNKVEYSASNQHIASKLDEAEADGETSGIEITATGLLFVNLYTENTAGNKQMDRFLLGELFKNDINHVNDYYDDPRLAAT